MLQRRLETATAANPTAGETRCRVPLGRAPPIGPSHAIPRRRAQTLASARGERDLVTADQPHTGAEVEATEFRTKGADPTDTTRRAKRCQISRANPARKNSVNEPV
jgi:hypothetical protein